MEAEFNELSDTGRSFQSAAEISEDDLRYQKLLQISPVPVLLHAERIIQYANASCADLVEADSVDDLIGRDVMRFVHAEDREWLVDNIERALTVDEMVPPLHTRLVGLNGRQIDAEISSVGINYRRRPAVMTQIRDVTAENENREALSTARLMYQTVAENALTGNAVIQDGKFVYVNPRLAEIFGYEQNDLIGQPALTVIHPDYHELVVENIRRRIEGEASALQYLAKGNHREGKTVYVEIFGAASEIDGRPAIIGTLIDVTPRVLMENDRERHLHEVSKFSERLKMLHRIATRSFDSLDHALKEYLSAGCEIFDLPIGMVKRIDGDQYEIVAAVMPEGMELERQLFPLEGSYCSRVASTMQTVAFAHAAQDTQFAHHPVYEKTLIESYLGAPIIIDGDVYGTIAFSSNEPRAYRFSHQDREIMELAAESLAKLIRLNRAEKKAKASRTALRRRARELKRARDRAEAAARTKSEFMAKLSHEIRTPMNGIMGMADLLLESNLSKDQIHHLETIHSSGESLLHLINDLLDFSKIEAGKLELESTPFSVQTIVEEVTSLFALKAMKKGLRISSYVHPDVPHASVGDPHRLRQALSNIVNNAVKFTDVGEIDIRVTPADGQENVLEFVVRDTGIGVDPSAQTRIFDAFAQADATTTRRFGGTGLGLAITRQIAHMMGGTITLESEPERGSTFTFRAPFAEDESAESVGRPADTRLHDLYVLVVESSNAARELLTAQLRDWGVKVDESADATSALQMIISASESGTPYDAALIARGLPGMDGANLARAVDAIPSIHGLPMILLAPFDDPVLGASGHLPLAGTLALPIRREPLRHALLSIRSKKESQRRQGSEGDVDPASRPTCRILVAEDDPVSQEVLMGMLSALGYEADLARSGGLAIEAAARNVYDLVLMDCEMPGMDGYAATARIRELDSPTADAFVVAVTAHSLRGDKERSLLAGMDDHMSKPLTRSGLTAVIQAASRRSADSDPDAGAIDEASSSTPDDVETPDDPISVRLAALREGLGDRQFVELVIVFLHSVPAYLADIRAAIGEQDAPHVAHSAHVLRGAATNLELRRLSKLAEALEKKADRGDLAEAEVAFAEIESAWSAVRPRFARIVDAERTD